MNTMRVFAHVTRTTVKSLSRSTRANLLRPGQTFEGFFLISLSARRMALVNGIGISFANPSVARTIKYLVACLTLQRALGPLPVMRDRVSKTIPYREHYLLLFCNLIDTIATLTADASLFGQLSPGDKSLCMGAAVRISRDSIKVKSSPHEILSISMLDFRRRSIITSGSRVSSDCQHEGTK